MKMMRNTMNGTFNTQKTDNLGLLNQATIYNSNEKQDTNMGVQWPGHLKSKIKLQTTPLSPSFADKGK